MRKLLTLSAILLAVVTSSCSKFDDTAIWDKLNEQEQTLNDHEKRIAALEELCRQLNTNIDALQTIVEALEKKDYVTNVSPVREDGEIVGYTISFANSDTITIYNGKDGVDGKDGYTPQIGVMKDTDGIYYWTVDGEWLLDGKGNKIKAIGEDGRDGQDGTNGVDGIDGIAPRLKIENDYWYVSYDEGATWIELGKATGEDGSNGIDGVDGDSIFSSVTQDDEYVYFNLADGTMITLPKHDKENIQFEDLQVKAICCKNWDTNNDGELSYSEAAVVTDIGTAFKENTDIIAFAELRYFTGITKLSNYAFYSCRNLWKIELPPFLTEIGERAFNGCSSIQSMCIHKNVISIGSYAFGGCTGSLYVCCNIPNHAFRNSDFTDVVFGDEVVTIGEGAFDSSSLQSVIIPNNITYIGKQAFYSSSVQTVIISDGVSVIDEEAFSRCNKLETVVIGKGIVMIGNNAFQQNNESVLSSFYIKATVPPALPSHALHAYYTGNYGTINYTMPSSLCIYVPEESVDVYKTKWSEYSGKIVGYDFNE